MSRLSASTFLGIIFHSKCEETHGGAPPHLHSSDSKDSVPSAASFCFNISRGHSEPANFVGFGTFR